MLKKIILLHTFVSLAILTIIPVQQAIAECSILDYTHRLYIRSASGFEVHEPKEPGFLTAERDNSEFVVAGEMCVGGNGRRDIYINPYLVTSSSSETDFAQNSDVRASELGIEFNIYWK